MGDRRFEAVELIMANRSLISVENRDFNRRAICQKPLYLRPYPSSPWQAKLVETGCWAGFNEVLGIKRENRDDSVNG
jgi:hypothetical protein